MVLQSNGDPSSWLQEVARRDPNRVFIETATDDTLTYGDTAALCGRMAAALVARGVRPGDRVVAQVEKSPQAVALYLACLRAGAVFVPLNTAYTAAELEYFLRDSEPSLVIGRPDDADLLRQLAHSASVRHVETLGEAGNGSFMELTRSQADELTATDPLDGSALAALLYTSGTTGRSKGAMLTRANLASNAQTLASAWRFTERDVLLHALPIFHVHGLFVAINSVLASGSSMLFLRKFAADDVLRLLPRASVMMGVPTFYTRLLKHPALTAESTRNVRLFVSGSAPLLPATHREFLERTGHAILERYGMSETLMNTSNPYDGERVPGSVGPALPGIEVRITDPESGALIRDPDAIGMIEVRGPNVFSGYWRMPEKTRAEFRPDRFFITGDLGRLDERGYLYIVGRGKDLIISGGYNVYPIEVESELDALPGVLESAVIGLPHADFGEAVTAVVVPRPGASLDEEEIRAALGRRLARYKVPKRVLVASELPRNTMGKVQKALLREAHRDLYRDS
ncbi:MAG TPA: malonyl-CoA synthase [Steroidobacteraceae bacterium]